jgi:hypothetical protein
VSDPTIGRRRLASQLVTNPRPDPAEVVARLGAVQAQDFLGALWGIGVRTGNGTERAVEAAVAAGEIVRTWPMRGTLHFVARADVHWMVELLAPRVVDGSSRRHRELELDARVFSRCRKLVERWLGGGRRLSRPALFRELDAAGIATAESRGLHIVGVLAQRRVICFGPREGKQPTFVLLDEWVPRPPALAREEALARLATRYFTGHGPATIADFAWWSGLRMTEAREAVELGKRELGSKTIDGTTYWSGGDGRAARRRSGVYFLPPFDEFTVGYRDRSAVLDPAVAKRVNAGGGILHPVMVAGGRVVGTWTRALGRTAVTVRPEPFAPLGPTACRSFEAAARRYGRFLGLEPEVRW